MANRIENSDLFAPNLGKETVETFKQLNVVLDGTEQNLKDILKITVDVSKTIPKTQKEVKAFSEATQKQTQTVQLLDKVQKQRQQTLEKITVLESKRGKQLEKTKLQLQKVRQETKQSIKENNKLNSSYERATAKLNRLGKELKDVAFREGANAKATRKLAKEYDVLRSKVFKAEKVAGQFQRNVGNYPSVVGKATAALRNMGLAFGGLAIIRNVFSTVKDFEQSIANLSAITGATGKDLKFLEDRAIELGSKTTLSAGQVAEGFKLIASAKPELLDNAEALANVTEQSIILAEAAGVDLPTAAKSLTLSLNQFNAGAEESAKFIDVLAAGSKKGSGDVNFLNAALLKVGGTANAAGLSFKDTVAALETLAPVLGTGEEAGTKFRNILASLQKEGIGFASGQFNINDAIAETNKKLEAIDDPAKKAAERIRLFGRQNDAAAIQLLTHTDNLEEFQVTLDENGIALEQQAINNDTLQGALLKVQSAWEGMILKLEQGTGAFGALKGILVFVADNLETIVKIVLTLGTAFLVYKTIDKVTKSFKALTLAINANPFALIAAAIVALTVAIAAWSSEMTEAEKVAKTLLDVQNEAAKSTVRQKTELKRLLAVAQDKEQSDENRIKAIKEINKISPEYLGNLTLENINTAEGVKLIDQYVTALNRKATAQAAQNKLIELNERLLDAQTSSLQDNVGFFEKATSATFSFGSVQGAVDDITAKSNANKKKTISTIEAEIKALEDLINAKVKSGEIDVEGVAGSVDDAAATAVSKRKKQLDEGIGDYLNFIEEDKRLKQERLTAEEQQYQLELKAYEEFIQEDKDLRGSRELDEDQEYERRLSDYEAFIDEDKELKELRLQQEAELLQEQTQFVIDGAGALNDLLQAKADERIALLDKELAANQAFQANIIALNQKGVISTEENIAFEKKKAAELELLKQQELELQAKRELVVTAVQTYAGYVQSGETGASALASTVTDIGVLKAFINTLDFFLDGTDSTGTVTSPLDPNGGRIAMLHDNEQIWSQQNVKDGGGRTRNEAINALNEYDSLGLGSNYNNGNNAVNKAMQMHRFQSNSDVVAMGDKLETAIKESASTTHFDYDNMKDSFIRSVRTEHKIENFIYKKSKLF